jgi:hypothetical protein
MLSLVIILFYLGFSMKWWQHATIISAFSPVFVDAISRLYLEDLVPSVEAKGPGAALP